MLVGLYGGTFDPVHIGHVHVAKSVREHLGLSEIRWVLSARPGHRGEPSSGIVHRWNMLQALCNSEPGFIADDVEVRNQGLSFTFNTVVAFRRRSAQFCPCWIMGQDSFATLDTWYRWQNLLDYCNLVIVDRPGNRVAMPPEIAALEERHIKAGLCPDKIGQIVRLNVSMLPLSATEIRRKLNAGEAVEDLLARPVYTYIRRYQLYSENTA